MSQKLQSHSKAPKTPEQRSVADRLSRVRAASENGSQAVPVDQFRDTPPVS